MSNATPISKLANEHRGLTNGVIRFAAFLKARGFRVYQSSVQDSLRGLEQIDLLQKRDVLSVLRANLATNDLEWARFAELFEDFWSQTAEEDAASEPAGEQTRRETLSEAETVQEDVARQSAESSRDNQREWLEGIAYSPVSGVAKKDFADFDSADVQQAQLALKRIMAPFRLQAARRSRRSRRPGRLDFPQIMRRSLKTEGLPVELFFRAKRKRLKRLVVLADVSGSMDRYARFVLPFLLSWRGIGSRAEIFVFSTSLTRITAFVRHLSVEQALESIMEEVPEWSGGTRIGYSLHQFNQQQGAALLNRRTVVVIMSDGWDLGGKELLRREMANISGRAHCVIWLNPLAGDPEYRPVCQGMRVALPHVDYFLPADSLQNLQRVGRVLSRVIIH